MIILLEVLVCLKGENLVGCWVFCYFWCTWMMSQLFRNIFVWKNDHRGKNTIPSTQICCGFISTDVVDCWFHFCHQEYVDCCIFNSFWLDHDDIGEHFSSLIIINPMFCVTFSACLISPLHNITQPLSTVVMEKGMWWSLLIWAISVVTLEPSSSRVHIGDSKKIKLATFGEEAIGVEESPVLWTCFVPSLMSMAILGSQWGVVMMEGKKTFWNSWGCS